MTNTRLHTFLAITHKKGKRHLPSPWHSFHSFSYSWCSNSPRGHFSGVICTTVFEISRKPFRLFHFLPDPWVGASFVPCKQERTDLNLPLNVAQKMISRRSSFLLIEREDRWGWETWFIAKPKQIRDNDENKNGQIVNISGNLLLRACTRQLQGPGSAIPVHLEGKSQYFALIHFRVLKSNMCV